jgi:hypothetical protein
VLQRSWVTAGRPGAVACKARRILPRSAFSRDAPAPSGRDGARPGATLPNMVKGEGKSKTQTQNVAVTPRFVFW